MRREASDLTPFSTAMIWLSFVMRGSVARDCMCVRKRELKLGWAV